VPITSQFGSVSTVENLSLIFHVSPAQREKYLKFRHLSH